MSSGPVEYMLPASGLARGRRDIPALGSAIFVGNPLLVALLAAGVLKLVYRGYPLEPVVVE